MARLRDRYKTEIKPQLAETLRIKNPMAIPRLEKVVLSMGLGAVTRGDKNLIPNALSTVEQITGQKPVVKRARKSVSNFKLRKGMDIGCMVTLRGRRMYEFVDRLINAAIPRLRDFRGLNPRSFDGRGNYSMGVADQSIFAEIDQGSITITQGMNITFVTSAEDDAGGRELLTLLGMPFRRSEERKN